MKPSDERPIRVDERGMQDINDWMRPVNSGGLDEDDGYMRLD